MLTMALAGRIVTDWTGDPTAVLSTVSGSPGRWSCRTTTAGATVEITAVVGELDADAGTARVDITAKFNGQTVLGKARAVVRLP